MKMDESRIEEILKATPPPEPPAGLLERLRADLPAAQQTPDAPAGWTHRIAWVGAAMLALAVTAWGAQKIYKTYIRAGGIEMVPAKQIPAAEVIWSFDERGTKKARMDQTSGTHYVVRTIQPQFRSTDPEFNNKLGAKQLEEVRKQILDGKGKLLRKNSDGTYIYSFKLADGNEVEYTTKKTIDVERDIMRGEKVEVFRLGENGLTGGSVENTKDLNLGSPNEVRSLGAGTPPPNAPHFIVTTDDNLIKKSK